SLGGSGIASLEETITDASVAGVVEMALDAVQVTLRTRRRESPGQPIRRQRGRFPSVGRESRLAFFHSATAHRPSPRTCGWPISWPDQTNPIHVDAAHRFE